MVQLGKRVELNPKDVWQDERHFSDWLIEHLSELGDALSMNLIEPEREKIIGRYYADIVCQDLETGVPVVIENQFTRSDHDHLGKIITYAGGHEAGGVIWVAPEFRDEHRTALNWLNAKTHDDLSFFAVAIQLYRIDASLPAFLPQVVVKPDHWRRTIQNRGGSKPNTPSQVFFLEFWEAFRTYLEEEGSSLNPGNSKKGPYVLFNIYPPKDASVWPRLEVNLKQKTIRLNLAFFGRKSNPERSQQWFEFIDLQKTELETEIGFDLEWFYPEGNVEVHLFNKRMGIELEDRENWLQVFAWIDADMTVLRDAGKRKLEEFLNL